MQWKKLTGVGQIKQGDKIRLSFNGEEQIHTAKEILMQKQQTEEILLNKRQNLYFIVSMAVDGTSWAKDVKYLSCANQ
jgi:hypothetical protein